MISCFFGRTFAIALLISVIGVCLFESDAAFAAPPTLAVGQTAPDFDLPVSGDGDTLKLSDAVSDGSVVVVVLRGFPGYQCPLCSRQVAKWVQSKQALAEKVSRVIFVYPGEPNLLEQHAAEFAPPSSLPVPFVMVRDPGYTMVNSYGLRWDAPRETAYPSTFVIGPDRKIQWQKISRGHGDRSDPQAILSVLN